MASGLVKLDTLTPALDQESIARAFLPVNMVFMRTVVQYRGKTPSCDSTITLATVAAAFFISNGKPVISRLEAYGMLSSSWRMYLSPSN